jgi:hypothetical protein
MYNKTQGKDVIFKAHKKHWGAAPAIDIMTVKYYPTHAAVMQALQAGSLDGVVGSGVLTPSDLNELKTKYTQRFDVFLGPVIQNRLIILNGAKHPTDDIELRKAIIHAVDKAHIIEKELYGSAAPVDSLFPKNAPYAGVDLLPRWDYDNQKARMLQCPGECDDDHDHDSDHDHNHDAVEVCACAAKEEEHPFSTDCKNKKAMAASLSTLKGCKKTKNPKNRLSGKAPARAHDGP